MIIGTGNEYIHEGKTYKLLGKISERELDIGDYNNLATVYSYKAECDGQVCTVQFYEKADGDIEFKVI